MNLKTINDINVYRPSVEAENLVYKEIKSRLLERYSSKEYKDSKVITEILNYHFSSYEKLIEKHLKLIVSRGLVEFLCYQYDQYALVEQEFKDHRLSNEDEEFWQSYGNLARRAIKYLLEMSICIAIKNMNPTVPFSEIEHSLSIILIAAEELTRIYLSSDQTHILFPKDSILTINQDKYNYLNLGISFDFKFDVRKEVHQLSKIVGLKNILTDVEKHNELIGSSFKESFGVDYATILNALYELIENAQPDPKGLPVLFLKYETVINAVSNKLKINNVNTKKIIDGFSLYKGNMISEKRRIYNPKQENRALKRGFFVYPHETGDHLLFSKTMAKECLLFLLSDIPFKNIPTEWATVNIKKSLDNLSNKVGTWFEKKVSDELMKIGIPSINSVKKLNFKDKSSKSIPSEVGEIDIIAYSDIDNILIIIECKLAKPATEPKFFRKDLDSFISAKDSYKNKFIKKYKWVEENFLLVSKYVEERLTVKIKATKIGFAMVTFHPTVAAKFIEDFSCISIAELISTLEEEKNWKFSYLDVKN